MRIWRGSLSCVLFFFLCCPDTKSQDSSPDSGEAFIIEQIHKEVTFQRDGRSQGDESLKVRILSSAGLQDFGVLTFPYRGENETLEIVYVRVRKADGTVVATPDSNIQDMPSEVTRTAPLYSDFREKQIPVKALGVGDTLEYQIRHVSTKPEIPGEFFYAHDFTRTGIVREEILSITVPADKYVKVSSPGRDPLITLNGDLKTYSWVASYQPPAKSAKSARPPTPAPSDHVQLTTFRSWADLGTWYASLQKPKVEVNDAIRAKAAELTAGLKTDSEKLRAIYTFVSSKFRYISLSFGIGRYAPHAASEVLADQYGDCKDKHTLLAALLKAVGIPAYPALLGVGIKLDPDLPSVAQFNHLITYIPSTNPPTWLDTTPEVAPYGMLMSYLRGKQALVIPDGEEAHLVRTPDSPPFPCTEVIEVKGKLDASGTFTGHFDLTSRGDSEVMLRSLFHVTAPARWTELLQTMSRNNGYGGTVSQVDVQNLNDLELPFRYSYDYDRKGYSDWSNHRITPPFPIFALPHSDEEEPPSEPIEFGVEGKFLYRATIELPRGYSTSVPSAAHYQAGPITYTATYSFANGVISAVREFTLKKHSIETSDWERYRSFGKEVLKEQSQFFLIVVPGSSLVPSADSIKAAEFVMNAWAALDKRDLKAADELLTKAQALDDHATGLWSARAHVYELQGDKAKAIEVLERSPADTSSIAVFDYLVSLLRQTGRVDEELTLRRNILHTHPENTIVLNDLVSLLAARKRYLEAVDPLTAAIRVLPADTNLQVSLFKVLLFAGKTDQAMEVLSHLRAQRMGNDQLNTTGYHLVNTGVNVTLGRELIQQSIDAFNGLLKNVTLDTLSDTDFRNANSLGAAWDSLGWAAFKTGDLVAAEKFVKAAWNFQQHAGVADHLGQIYERQGKKDQAVHMYRLSLAVSPGDADVKQRLSALGAQSPTESELSQARLENTNQRNMPVKGLSLRTTSAANFLFVFSAKGLEEIRFEGGDSPLKTSVDVLRRLPYPMMLPEGSPARIPRQALLSCSAIVTPPDCRLSFFAPANSKSSLH